jgi:hypothetical protein
MSRFRSHRVPSSSGHPAPARSHLLHSCRPSQSTRERSFFWSRPRGGRIAGGKGLLIGFLKFVIVISEGLVGLPGRVVVRHPNAPLSMFPQCCANVFGVPPELFAPGPSPKTGAKRIRSHRWLRSKALRCASARPGSRSRHLGMRRLPGRRPGIERSSSRECGTRGQTRRIRTTDRSLRIDSSGQALENTTPQRDTLANRALILPERRNRARPTSPSGPVCGPRRFCRDLSMT